LCLLALCLLTLQAEPIGEKVQIMPEYQAKSAFLFKICKFTTWSRPSKPGNPIIISILGQTTPGHEIDIPGAKQIQKKKIVVREIKKLSDIGDSHVLFIRPSETYRIDEILSFIEDKDILSVGDTRGFAQKGIMVNFYLERGSVRFEINRDAAKKSQVKLNSQLFGIGRVVGGDHG
ncbi:MAG: YfiR family protein, partial [bacterium]|nr:YfiR family protein [bacterium]